MVRRATAVLGVGLALAAGGFGQNPAGKTVPAHTSAAPPPPAAQVPTAATAAPAVTPAPDVRVLISIPDQRLAVLVNGKVSRSYKISTSRYGEGDSWGSWQTPLGRLEVAHKIGGNAPAGAVFKSRQLTGEVLSPNAPGRDPIVSRIIWLRGLEFANKRAYQRCIYIHGTPQETFLGRKASFGCIRMRSADVIEVYGWLNIGTDVAIVSKPMAQAVRAVQGEVKEALARTTVAAIAKVSAGRSGIQTTSPQTAPPQATALQTASNPPKAIERSRPGVQTASVH
ncbi:MAG: L,D-transpeptidase [Verrucomicrobia bacterium]|nr:L,D-transpeptidase [Verrucomicrobiota bacterium]